MNPFTDVNFGPAPCLPCCTTPVTGCSCALLIPPFAPVYSDYATAAAAITDQTSNCIAYYTANHLGSFVAGFDGTLFNVSGNDPGGGLNQNVSIYASLSLLAGQIVSAAYTITTGDPFRPTAFTLLDCATGSQIDQSTDAASSGTLTVTAPSDSEYIIVLSAGSNPGTFGAFALDGIISNSGGAGTWWVNPVIALWDDSGTTRSLWACPKLLLPPSTEASGDWYADCATANADLTSTQVSNCVGFADPASAPGAFTSFTATDGGSSLTLDILYPGTTSATQAMYGGVNAVAGQTLDFSFTSDAGVPFFGITIFDDEGNVIESGGRTSPYSSAALPYTGRYTILVQATDLTPFPGVPTLTTANFVITSSGTMSVNPVQARYDLGLVCAGTLNCGDACP